MRLVRSSKQTTGTLKLFPCGSAGIPGQDSQLQTRELGHLRGGDTVRGGGGQFRQHLKVSLFARTHTHTHTRPPGPARGDAASPGRGEQTCADFRARGPAADSAYPAAAPRAPDAKAGTPRACRLRPPRAAAIGSTAGLAPLPVHARPGAARASPRRPTAPGRPRARPRGRQGRTAGRPPAVPTMVQMEASLETVIRISIRPAPSST